MKVCSKCKKEKYPNEFWKLKSNKDGLYSSCIECTKEKNKEQYQKHIDKRKIKRKEVYRSNVEEAKKKTKEWADNNRQRVRAYHRERYHNMTNEEKNLALERKRKFDRTEKGKQASKKYRKGPKWVARYTFRNAIRDGKIEVKTNCSVCLSNERIEGHHPDYTKPLDVIWLCRKCHSAVHQSIKRREKHESNRVQQKDSQ